MLVSNISSGPCYAVWKFTFLDYKNKIITDDILSVFSLERNEQRLSAFLQESEYKNRKKNLHAIIAVYLQCVLQGGHPQEVLSFTHDDI